MYLLFSFCFFAIKYYLVRLDLTSVNPWKGRHRVCEQFTPPPPDMITVYFEDLENVKVITFARIKVKL